MLSRILGTHLTAGSARTASCLTTPLCRATAVRGLPGLGWGISSSSSGLASPSAAHGGGSSPAAVLITRRFVQFEQTSETMQGINKNKRALHHRWVTKSTKEYMSEADSKTTKGNAALFARDREDRKAVMAQRKDRYSSIMEESERTFELEMDRLRDDRSRRLRKGYNFFKRQGKAFTLLYLFAYFGTLSILYAGFASGLLKKEAAFEFTFLLLQSYIDREKFFERVEAWDTYTNLGFAFVINELLEVMRFPVVMFCFYQFRPYLTGVNMRVKSSIFRFTAAES